MSKHDINMPMEWLSIPDSPRITASKRKTTVERTSDIVERTSDIVEQEMINGDQRMWSVHGDHYFPCDKAEKKLPPGQYIPLHSDSMGYYLAKKQVNVDELIVLPDSKTEYLVGAMNDFWQREAKFVEHGFLWKRGMLLYGPPGSGKTAALQLLSQQVVNNGGVTFYCMVPHFTAECLRIFRRIEPARPVIVLIEDVDAIINKFGEPELLALLDGELQIKNVFYVATTNYPELLDPRFVQRPSRFDEVIYVGMPSEEARKEYLLKKNPRLRLNTLSTQEELSDWLLQTKGFSIAAIKECIVSVECLGRSLNETVKRIRTLMTTKPTSEDNDNKSKVGFD